MQHADNNYRQINPDRLLERTWNNLIELGDLGAIQVNGFATPLPIGQAMRPSAVESRMRWRCAPSLSLSLVETAEELDQLSAPLASRHSWRQADVLMKGETDTGKRR